MEYKLKHVLQHEDRAPILCTKFNPTGLLVASGSSNGRLVIWSIDSGSILWTLSGHVALLSLEWLLCSEDKEWIFCGYMDGIMLVIEMLKGSLVVSGFRVLSSPLESMAIRQHPTGLSIATGGCQEISIWRGTPPDLQFICQFPCPKSTVGNAGKKVMLTSLHWMSDLTLLATYLFHGIVIFNVETALPSRIIQIPSMIVTAHLSIDLKHIVVNDSISGFAMYDITSKGWPERFDSCESCSHTSLALGTQIIHNNQALMTGSADGFVRLWDIRDKYVFGTLDHGRGVIVNCFAAYYIEQKDVFLLVTGVAHPAEATGIRVWQTIGSIDDNSGRSTTTSALAQTTSARVRPGNKALVFAVFTLSLVIGALLQCILRLLP